MQRSHACGTKNRYSHRVIIVFSVSFMKLAEKALVYMDKRLFINVSCLEKDCINLVVC